MLARMVTAYFQIALSVFFRRIVVEGADSVPSAGPVLLVSNHANALVDPFLVMRPLRRRVHLTAKSTLSKSPLLRFVAWALDVVVFHRRQDRDLGANPAANRESLNLCRERLHAGGAVCIFPEGQSHSEPVMRRFLSGVGRIALDYLETYPEGPALRIVPVGLHYEQKDRYRSTAWVRYGVPIDVVAWSAANPEGGARALTQRVEGAVRDLQVDFDSQNDPTVLNFLAALMEGEGRAPRQLGVGTPQAQLPTRLRSLQRTRRQMREFEPRRLAVLESRVVGYRRKLGRLGIAPSEVFLRVHAGRALFFLLRELELFFIGLPIRLWGLLNHGVPFQIVKSVTLSISKDEDQVASNATFLSLPIFPLFYLVQTLAVSAVAGAGIASLYLISLPYSGYVAVLHRDRSGGAWRRARTFLSFLRSPTLQDRLVAEGHELLALVRKSEREMARRGEGLVVDFREESAEILAITGGKGANLSRTTRLGFPVPPGKVIASVAYETFAASVVGSLGEDLAALGLEDEARSIQLALKIRTRILDETLPDPVVAAIEREIMPLLELGPVAVRSSSTQEDLEGAAFAGQHDTFLHITTMSAVLDSVRRCYASLWEYRAVRYRLEGGFRLEEASMAVVVQTMVAAEVAGVAFSVHPVSGAMDHVLVNAAYGLGETVVSGDGEIDQFVVERQGGQILETRVASKGTRLVGSACGGVKSVPVAEAQAVAPCLEPPQLAQIVELAVQAEGTFGFPQDIEWALVGGSVYLLQSRPVSAIPPRWTRDESAERFPNPITPLVWDFTRDGFHESLAFSLDLMGLPPFNGLWFERFEGYIYGNQNAVDLYAKGRGFPSELLRDARALERYLAKPYVWVRELPVVWMRDLDRYLLALGRLEARSLEALDARDLWAHIEEVDRVGREYFRPNIAISLTQGALHRLLFAMVQALVGPEFAAELHDDLTCFCETKTALVNSDLLTLSRLAAADEGVVKTLRSESSERLWQSGHLSRFSVFEGALGRFLEDHGHREVEFDAYVPTWSGQPWVVLDHIRLLLDRVGAKPLGNEVTTRNRQHRAEVRFMSQVPENLRFVVGEVLRLTRVYTALDDLEHYETTRLSVPFRKALVRLGSRFVGREALSSPEDIFFLQRSEVEELFEGGLAPEESRKRSLARKAEYSEQWKNSPPLILGESEVVSGEGDLTGIPGSPGTSEGPVFRVFSAEDFSKFPPGAVLVARTTNPAWTPLFYSATAVITESGGPLSHGAVTAREIGLPAVMAVPSALSLFIDGERVRVHGSAGVVERLDSSAPKVDEES